MDLCDNCQSNPVLLAQRLAKVSIFGSSGTFNVGVDPDPLVVDPMPPSAIFLLLLLLPSFLSRQTREV